MKSGEDLSSLPNSARVWLADFEDRCISLREVIRSEHQDIQGEIQQIGKHFAEYKYNVSKDLDEPQSRAVGYMVNQVIEHYGVGSYISTGE